MKKNKLIKWSLPILTLSIIMGGTISLVTSCAKKNEERVELGFLSLLPTFMQDVLGFKYVASSNGNISDYSVIMTTVDDLSPQGIINASTPSGMGYIYSNSQNLAFIYYPQSGNDNTKSSNSNKEFEPEDQIKLFFNDLPQHSNVSIRCWGSKDPNVNIQGELSDIVWNEMTIKASWQNPKDNHLYIMNLPELEGYQGSTISTDALETYTVTGNKIDNGAESVNWNTNYSWTGKMPSGMSIDSGSGVISGTVPEMMSDERGDYYVKVTSTNKETMKSYEGIGIQQYFFKKPT